MFVKSFKISGRRLIAIGAMCLAVIGLVVYGVGNRISQPRGTQVETATKPNTRVAKGGAKTEADRAAFISQFGWEVDAEPVEILEVAIPEDFDDVFLSYNELQKQQGYDLEKHKGERAKRYSYHITNYPDAKQEVRISIMVLDGRVIGGDVSSTALNGFMQGFAKDSSVMDTANLEPPIEEHSTLADETPIEETMAAELAEMEEALRENLEERVLTQAQMPTD